MDGDRNRAERSGRVAADIGDFRNGGVVGRYGREASFPNPLQQSEPAMSEIPREGMAALQGGTSHLFQNFSPGLMNWIFPELNKDSSNLAICWPLFNLWFFVLVAATTISHGLFFETVTGGERVPT
jgi:hypothetical protein